MKKVILFLASIAVATGQMVSWTAPTQIQRKPFVDVRDYGAKCDGSTNDNIAFNLAINSGAKVVDIPAGTCNITNLVVYNKEGFTLRGAGSGQGDNAGTTLKYVGSANGVVLTWKSNRWSNLRDLYIDCNALAGKGIYNWADMGVASSQKNRFENIGIRGCSGTPGYALQVGDATNADVSQSEYNNVTMWASPVGLYQDGTQTLLNVYKNMAFVTTTTGAYFVGGDIRMEHNNFIQTTAGVDDVYVGGAVLWAYFYGNYHEITAGRPSNATAYNFPSSGVRGYSTNLLNTRVLWQRVSGNVISFTQGGPFTLDSCVFDSAGVGVGVVNIASAGSYKTTWRSMNTLYTSGITRTVGSGTSLLRDYDTVAASDPLGTGTSGGLYGSNLTLSIQKLLVGVTAEVDSGSSIEISGSLTMNNFKAIKARDTVGSAKSLLGLAPDNTVFWGTYNAPATNGHVIGYVNGTEVTRMVPGGRVVIDPAGSDDGVTRLQVNGSIKPGPFTFATLPATPQDGSIVYCSDCTVTSGADNTCKATGSGALAVRLASAWRCFNNQN